MYFNIEINILDEYSLECEKVHMLVFISYCSYPVVLSITSGACPSDCHGSGKPTHRQAHNFFVFCRPCILLWFLVNDQLDEQLFSMCLFQFSTCFEQPRAHHQENQMYQYNIWYTSLCAGDPFECRSESSFPGCIRNGHQHRVTYTRCCIDTFDSPDDEHEVARNM